MTVIDAPTYNRNKLYGRRWRNQRMTHLSANPLCVMCQQQRKVTPATVVDHIKPHNGDRALFWDVNNWQSLCQPHHDSTKQKEEKSGKATGVDAQGRPIDQDHPWNASEKKTRGVVKK